MQVERPAAADPSPQELQSAADSATMRLGRVVDAADSLVDRAADVALRGLTQIEGAVVKEAQAGSEDVTQRGIKPAADAATSATDQAADRAHQVLHGFLEEG